MAAGGRVLAPDSPDCTTQFIDARDITSWMIGLLERGITGTYQATSPADMHTFGSMLAECEQAARAGAQVTWVPERFLLDQGVAPWSELPLWAPSDRHGLVGADVSRALAAGLRIRPLAETVRDTLAWAAARQGGALRAGLTGQREAGLLAAWDASATGNSTCGESA
jgi:2'-hydroxyisoflavone reductase